MQQTPPLASISHSTPAARTPQTQRQHHTKGGGGESQWVGERGSFISSHHLLSLLWKKKKKRKFPAFFPPPLLFYAINLIPCKQQKRKEKKRKNAPKDFSPVFFLMQFEIRLERRWQEKRGEDEQPPLPEGGMMLFFFKERETTNVLWGSSLYSSHPSLHSLPVYSTCHLPLLPWLRLHMLPTGGGRGEEEELRTRE